MKEERPERGSRLPNWVQRGRDSGWAQVHVCLAALSHPQFHSAHVTGTGSPILRCRPLGRQLHGVGRAPRGPVTRGPHLCPLSTIPPSALCSGCRLLSPQPDPPPTQAKASAKGTSTGRRKCLPWGGLVAGLVNGHIEATARDDNGPVGALGLRGERAGAGQAVLAQRPDADFQGREPAPLTRCEMPALLNGEQLGRALHSSPGPGRLPEPTSLGHGSSQPLPGPGLCAGAGGHTCPFPGLCWSSWASLSLFGGITPRVP